MTFKSNRRELLELTLGLAALALTGCETPPGPAPISAPHPWNHPNRRIALNSQLKALAASINNQEFSIPSHLADSHDLLLGTWSHLQRHIFDPNAADKFSLYSFTRGARILDGSRTAKDALALGQLVRAQPDFSSFYASTQIETGELLGIQFYNRPTDNIDIRVKSPIADDRWPTATELLYLNSIFASGHVDAESSVRLLHNDASLPGMRAGFDNHVSLFHRTRRLNPTT